MEVLLFGAVACVVALISSAWLMTFAKWFPINGVDAFVIDYKTLIRAHVDYALMALFGLGFYGTGIELPTIACWCLAIGGFTNPTIFTIAAFDTEFWSKMKWKVFTAVSFMLTTIGFLWIAYALFVHAMSH
ncbi:hypothetical protein [Methylotenera versatilis]|uniref:hypothetical protein n=1 Tax=Methylotenera versatilis TaxID=1055487 RepID=UPI000645595D|nr:hypothetical protein [Methylotenera versatilis]